MPSSPASWLRWASYTLAAQGRPFSPRYEFLPPQDFRMRDSREAALRVKMILEDACNGTSELLLVLYVDEVPWYAFSKREQEKIRQGAAGFREELNRRGFIADPRGGSWGAGRSLNTGQPGAQEDGHGSAI